MYGRQTITTVIIAAVIASALGCRAAPVTQRRQVLLLPEANEIQMGEAAFQEMLKEQPLSQNQQYVELVQRVGHRIAAVANRPDYAWEFRVFASEEQNAFCLPGGKVGVYEGIIEVCQNEAELAVVMSHEVAHALQRHGGERMSHSYVANAAESAVRYALNNRDEMLRDRVLGAYGLATEYGAILPFSRTHELEADHVGLLLMAQAGYDPSAAPTFWARFSQLGGPDPPEFLSTHPSDMHRSTELKALQTEASALYQASTNKIGTGEVITVSATTEQAPPAN